MQMELIAKRSFLGFLCLLHLLVLGRSYFVVKGERDRQLSVTTDYATVSCKLCMVLIIYHSQCSVNGLW